VATDPLGDFCVGTDSANPLKDWFRLDATGSFPAKANLLKSLELAKVKHNQTE